MMGVWLWGALDFTYRLGNKKAERYVSAFQLLTICHLTFEDCFYKIHCFCEMKVSLL